MQALLNVGGISRDGLYKILKKLDELPELSIEKLDKLLKLDDGLYKLLKKLDKLLKKLDLLIKEVQATIEQAKNAEGLLTTLTKKMSKLLV